MTNNNIYRHFPTENELTSAEENLTRKIIKKSNQTADSAVENTLIKMTPQDSDLLQSILGDIFNDFDGDSQESLDITDTEYALGTHKILNITDVLRTFEAIDKKIAVCEQAISLLQNKKLVDTEQYHNITKALNKLRVQRESMLDEALKTNPDYYNYHFISQLKSYSDALDKGRLVQTKSVQRTISSVQEQYKAGQAVFISGPFGAGKTELAIEAAGDYAISAGTVVQSLRQKMGYTPEQVLSSSQESEFNAQLRESATPLIISGRKDIDASEIFGHQVLKIDEKTIENFNKINDTVEKALQAWQDQYKNNESSSKLSSKQISEKTEKLWKYYIQSSGTKTEYFVGPIYEAMRSGRGFILDEANGIPHTVLIGLNYILTRKPGDRINIQQDSGEQVVVKAGYTFTATGNVPDERGNAGYQGRQELDTALLDRMIKIKHGHLDQSEIMNRTQAIESGEPKELYEVLISMFVNKQGEIVAPAHIFDELWQFSAFIAKLQNIYTGKSSEELTTNFDGTEVPLTDALKKYTISWRGIQSMIQKWKVSGLQTPLKDIMKQHIQSSNSFIIASQVPAQLDLLTGLKGSEDGAVVGHSERISNVAVVAETFGPAPKRIFAPPITDTSSVEKTTTAEFIPLAPEQIEKKEEETRQLEYIMQTLDDGTNGEVGTVYKSLMSKCSAEFKSKIQMK
jgi:MoxR-like ATPase